MEARDFAFEMHEAVNQKYDNKSYMVHVDGAAAVGLDYIHLIPEEDRQDVMDGIYVHDVLEDTHATYNDIKKVLGETAAEYSYALQNEKGRTRAERANGEYYKGIEEFKHATFVKLCDRYANTKYGKDHGSSMFKKYKKENDNFIKKLYRPELQEMMNFIDKLLT
jgi:(p)ppGpp synthase/HD superfamily hydrolase